jgi:hypothetical protein
MRGMCPIADFCTAAHCVGAASVELRLLRRRHHRFTILRLYSLDEPFFTLCCEELAGRNQMYIADVFNDRIGQIGEGVRSGPPLLAAASLIFRCSFSGRCCPQVN